MHIPSKNTSEIPVLDFEEAFRQAQLESEEYDVARWLFVPNQYDEYRYILGTKGNHPLICFGINPSTARPDHLDPTLKSVERIALHNGFDSFEMMNVYAQRATTPDHMEKECNAYLHEQNLKAFEYLLMQCGEQQPVVWAAWGTIIEKRKYLSFCLKDFWELGKKYNVRWVCAGARSKAGHPHHPLYLKKDSQLEDFSMEDYPLWEAMCEKR